MGQPVNRLVRDAIVGFYFQQLVGTHAIKLQINSNLNMGDEEVKQVLRR
jgi:hypothetical protein